MPHVGAVLTTEDGRILGVAHRGEFAEGDHAEYTLLERKLANVDLTGAILYTTLEPCTKRKPQYISCAERVIKRRIAKVVIGMKDPNRDIYEQGIIKLRDAGIEVECFEPDSKFGCELAELLEEFSKHMLGDADKHIDWPRKVNNALDKRLSKAINKYSPRITDVTAPTWGTVLTVQLSPKLSDRYSGWSVKEINFAEPKTTEECYPLKEDNIIKCYKAYLTEYGESKGFIHPFGKDGDKFMLEVKPYTTSDPVFLHLQPYITKYSIVQFYKDIMLAKRHDERAMEIIRDYFPRKLPQKYDEQHIKNIADFFSDKPQITFPHALCLHLIILTQDNKVLLTKRSPRVEYYPDTWSCSIEENLSEKDFIDGKPSMEKWFERALREELALNEEEPDYLREDWKVLSVFLEAEVLNVSFAGIVKLQIHSDRLSEILGGRPRSDTEFSTWRFLDIYEELTDELLRNKFDDYHPTSAYRMYLALVWNFGPQKF